jgi:hypothetical protein
MAKATAHPDHRLISSEDVQNTDVYGAGDQAIGQIDHLLIDKMSGRVAYAVMSFGGFLGIGERYHPLPWRMLTYDTGLGGYVVDVTREKLEGAPSYTRDETPWSRPDYGRDVYSHYGMPYGSGI